METKDVPVLERIADDLRRIREIMDFHYPATGRGQQVRSAADAQQRPQARSAADALKENLGDA